VARCMTVLQQQHFMADREGPWGDVGAKASGSLCTLKVQAFGGSFSKPFEHVILLRSLYLHVVDRNNSVLEDPFGMVKNSPWTRHQ